VRYNEEAAHNVALSCTVPVGGQTPARLTTFSYEFNEAGRKQRVRTTGKLWSLKFVHHDGNAGRWVYGWRKEGRKTKWRLSLDGKNILKYVEAAESKEGPTESESLFTKIYFALTVSIDGHCVHYILCEKCQTKSLASCSALPPRTSNVSVYSTESGLDSDAQRSKTKTFYG